MPGVKKLSGLQKEVIHLYRQWVRMAHTKPIDTQPRFMNFIHEEFGKYRDLPRKDFTTIEYLLRTGSRRLQMYSQDDVKDIH
ncbi:similar to Saccharomyces cerevisiae YDR379C-A Protein involved in the assembly of the mitochondrial succinate dehydrogenase complex [Maudiozyma barnettii]|uniref:Similar to Saccharomyces cerevisiae YDR379C-A Protein involved in the assembly of the mitochondrial succinate dehydrogenase complex n=1 Tax=Maudiozyma barnettii TaxID=61262 RepID=A0A8H2VDU6_9SACH|nr:Sdh6p [Kazachstania barnettii]CAB4253744.1 similar to Saccharomyces cerevisiae YDR379C-A Protein involved in the assembly of the mitochondrial succinate dehydrogenase complex [Kazachstania barnettii]CAD1781492.1 similar to Saccharomyces cerevisiae YDR379C-A Protein involved in the assembly of the mitochondrial succinate dehydrogenase complex [Kazachstania barnettii]